MSAVKMQRIRIEHVLSAYHPIVATERKPRIGSVPITDIAGA
jgi:hypothetical protein